MQLLESQITYNLINKQLPLFVRRKWHLQLVIPLNILGSGIQNAYQNAVENPEYKQHTGTEYCVSFFLVADYQGEKRLFANWKKSHRYGSCSLNLAKEEKVDKSTRHALQDQPYQLTEGQVLICD